MDLKPGTRLACTGSTAQLIVVSAPAASVDLTCGGRPLVEVGTDGSTADVHIEGESLEGELVVGKRYEDAESGLELLCSAGGAGTLVVDDRTVDLKAAKPLPSSD